MKSTFDNRQCRIDNDFLQQISTHYLFLLRIINAAITPGIHPAKVSRKTISIEPQPLSITESGGKMMARMTRRRDMLVEFEWGKDRVKLQGIWRRA